MKAKSFPLVWALLCATSLTTSCAFGPLARLLPQKPSPTDSKVQPNKSTSDNSSDKQITADSSRLLKQEKFDELEKMALTSRINRERLPGGYWKLNAIQEGLAQPNLGQNASDHEWEVHLSRLEKWKASIPDSITARIALAESWVNFGWSARGDGYAKTVSDENWRLFHERTHKGYVELTSCHDMGEHWPEWYVAMLQVGFAEGWERRKYDQIFEAGFKVEPTYFHLQREKLNYLLPQWYGQEGDAAKFIENNSSRVQGDEGDILCFIMTTMMQRVYEGETLAKVPVPWQRIASGYEKLSQTYGVDRYRKNEFAYLALQGHFNTARKAMNEIGDDWDPEVWGSKQYFDAMKNNLVLHPELKNPIDNS
jgi:hypothetical protein